MSKGVDIFTKKKNSKLKCSLYIHLNPDPATPTNADPDLKLWVKSSVADPDPGSGALLTPGSGIGKKSGFGIKNADHISERLETIFFF